MMKTIERAHTPRKMWEKVKLSKSYVGALEQINKHLEFWPKFLVHKNKQRLTKITQYLIRCRKLAKQVRPALMTLPAKAEKREARREVKAQVAARLEASIESELLARLHSGTYNDIYNFPTKQYNKVLDANAQDEEEEEDADADEEEEEDEEEEGEDIEFVEGYEELEEEEDDMVRPHCAHDAHTMCTREHMRASSLAALAAQRSAAQQQHLPPAHQRGACSLLCTARWCVRDAPVSAGGPRLWAQHRVG
jgi:hypothetical protein